MLITIFFIVELVLVYFFVYLTDIFATQLTQFLQQKPVYSKHETKNFNLTSYFKIFIFYIFVFKGALLNKISIVLSFIREYFIY